MANGENKPILSQTINTREPIEFKQTIRLETDNESEIERVHNIYALTRITNRDIVDDVMTITGDSSIFALYQDAQGKLHELKTEVSFEEKISSVSASALLFEPEMVSYEILGFDKNSITVNCLFKIDVTEIMSKEVGMQISEDVALEKNLETVVISKVVGASTSSFTESGEFEVSGDSLSLLSREAKVLINNAFSGIDSITVEGEIIFKSLVEVNDKVQELIKILPFKQEVECFGANPGNVVDCSLYVSNIMAGVDNSAENSNVLSFTCEVNVNSICYTDENVENVIDAYSTTNETSLTIETVNQTNIKQVGFNSINLDFSADISGKFGVDEILGVLNPKLIATKVIKDDKAFIEGAVELVVVYKNNNEENFQTFQAVCPVNAVIDFTDEYNDISKLNVVIDSFKLKSGVMVEFEGKLYYTQNKSESLHVVYVSDVVVNEDERDNSAAIKVYTCEDSETLFDIAKKLNVTVEYLLSQNPSLQNGVNVGDKVYVYLPLEINF